MRWWLEPIVIICEKAWIVILGTMFTAICKYVDIDIYSSVSCYSNIPSRYCPIVLRMQTTTNNLFVCFINYIKYISLLDTV